MVKIIFSFVFLIFSIIGLSCSIHSFTVWINKPKNYFKPSLVISINEKTPNLEQIIRFYCGKNLTDKIIFFSTDKDESNKKICDIVSQNNSSVYFCNTIDEVGALIKNES